MINDITIQVLQSEREVARKKISAAITQAMRDYHEATGGRIMQVDTSIAIYKDTKRSDKPVEQTVLTDVSIFTTFSESV